MSEAYPTDHGARCSGSCRRLWQRRLEASSTADNSARCQVACTTDSSARCLKPVSPLTAPVVADPADGYGSVHGARCSGSCRRLRQRRFEACTTVDHSARCLKSVSPPTAPVEARPQDELNSLRKFSDRLAIYGTNRIYRFRYRDPMLLDQTLKDIRLIHEGSNTPVCMDAPCLWGATTLALAASAPRTR